VAHEQKRTLGAVAFEPREEARARSCRGVQLGNDPILLEFLLDIARGDDFVAGRVRGVENDQRLGMGERLGLEVRVAVGGVKGRGEKQKEGYMKGKGVFNNVRSITSRRGRRDESSGSSRLR